MSVETLEAPISASTDVQLPPLQAVEGGLENIQATPEKPVYDMTEAEFEEYKRNLFDTADTPSKDVEPPAQPSVDLAEQWTSDPEVKRQYGVSHALKLGMFSKARELAADTTGSEHSHLMAQIDRAEEQDQLNDEALREAPQVSRVEPPAREADATAELYTSEEFNIYAEAQNPEETTEALDAIADLDQTLMVEASLGDEEDAGLDLLGFGPRPPRVRAEAGEQMGGHSIDLSAKARAAWQKGRKAWEAVRGKAADATSTFVNLVGEKGLNALQKGGEVGAKVLRQVAELILGANAVGQASAESQRTYDHPAREQAAKAVYLEILAIIHEGKATNRPDLVSRALNAAHMLAVRTHKYDQHSYDKYDEILQLGLKEYPGEHARFKVRTADFRDALMTNDVARQNRILQYVEGVSKRTGIRHELEMFLMWRSQRYARR